MEYSIKIRIFECFIIIVCASALTDGRRYYRHSSEKKGEYDTRSVRPTPVDCPLQCRCIALSHISYRDMADRWNSMGQLHGPVRSGFKGTDAPVWEEGVNNLQGRDVVCMGLVKVPRPLPSKVTKLTLYGDSSASPDLEVADSHGHTQIVSIREHSFLGGDDLQQLTISGNSLQILYPFVFRHLPKLTHLALQNNGIQHISAASFATVTKLIELRLSDNMIRFLSPNVFNQLTHLEYLYLNGNKLSTLHMNVFRKLKKLRYLDLSRNSFRSLSESMFDGAINLQELLINENQIVFVRARWFRNLSKLRNLQIRANVITRIDPSSFQTLTGLEHLSLSANIINTVSNEAFKNLSQLQELDIGTNDINSLEPDCFAGLESLITLDLSGNRLSFVNNKTFTSTPTLRRLDLSKNSIKDIEEAALHPLKSLQELDLANNKLRKVKSKTFSGLLELKEVNLENNIIAEVENDAFIVASLNQLSKITWLSLQFNRIKLLNAYSLFGLPHLKFLNLGHNKVKNVHKKSFYTLSSLQNLLLNDNRIQSLEDGTFSNLKLLFSLNLEDNKLTEISDNTFIGLKQLDDLNIVSNALEYIAPNGFRHFTKLKRLDLNSNLISKFLFSDLILVKDLSYVDLSNNRLYDVQFPTQRTHNIRQLILSDNQLQTLTSDIVNVLSSAGNVWLRDNPWSCDCRMDWLPRLTSEYRLRLLGSRDTICKSPPKLYGKKIMEVESTSFQCNNLTVSKTLVCQNLQIRYSKSKSQETLRKGKHESRKWHVTVRDTTDKSRACNGILINDNWALTRSVCAKEIMQNNSDVDVKIGKRETRKIALTVDFQTNTSAADFDLRLVRFASRKSRPNSKDIPCILTHSQYHQLSRVTHDGVFTSRTYKIDTDKWNLFAKRGKIIEKCDTFGEICLKVRGVSNRDVEGSPFSLRYQGVWYLAGLGVATNSSDKTYQRFTPLWTVTNWISTTIHDIDNKCQFQSNRGDLVTLCENLAVYGVAGADRSKFVSV